MKVLKQFEFPAATNRSGKHDWSTLMDGSIRELTQGVDFSGKAKWFKVQCRLQAKKKGKKVRVHLDDNKVVVQFYDPTSEQQEQPSAAKSKK